MKKVKNTIPVYDICTINGHDQINPDIIAEPFAPYLEVHPNLYLPHRHTFYHLVLFTKGGGYHTIDFEKFDVAAGQIYFMSPGQVHSWSFEGETDGYVINFSESLFLQFLVNKQFLDDFTFFRSVAAESVFLLSEPAYTDVRYAFEKIVGEVHSNDRFANDAIRACLTSMFVAVQRTVSKKDDGVLRQNDIVLHNFRKLVNEYYAQKRLPKEYAAMLYITPNHLNALCKDLLDKSAGEVIRDRILLEAKRLLVNVNLAISEIAYGLNFTDNSHFTKFFKKHTGVTPEEFIKNPVNKQ